jgi:DNA-binding transcriptional LysR family regulator
MSSEMATTDLNLLRTLDLLLREGSVTGAARKLKLSPSAMSRTLARLRTVTGDQLLVRAGRGLVRTARAEELQDRVQRLVEEAETLLRPSSGLKLATLERTFTLRTSDGFAETLGPLLVNVVRAEAPRVQLRFVRKLDKDSRSLREGSADLETGVLAGPIGPEIRVQTLFTDRYVGVVRKDHPIARKPVTARVYASWGHVVAWRPGLDLGKIDEGMSALGLKRDVMTTVDGFSAALALSRGSDLIATVPERHTAGLRDGMHSFPVPVPVRDFTISLFWHPRLDGDAAHRWLRGVVREVCKQRFARAGLS